MLFNRIAGQGTWVLLCGNVACLTAWAFVSNDAVMKASQRFRGGTQVLYLI